MDMDRIEWNVQLSNTYLSPGVSVYKLHVHNAISLNGHGYKIWIRDAM